jgi:RNA polymerase sigma factor (sigma-70 family)
MQTLTDAELMEAYSYRQDEGAFGELMRRHGAMVYRACHRLLKDAHEAEDASQAVFVVLARKAGGLRKGDLAAWLYRVAHLVAAETVRKRMHRAKREESYAVDEAIQTGGFAASDVADAALLGLVDAALLSLPERCREAVILRYLQNHSEAEAARRVGCAVGTLSSRASRGIERLRQRLAKSGVALGGVALASLLTSEASAAIPETLLPSILATVKTAAATTATATTATTTAAMLAKGAIKALFWNSVKTAVVAAVSAGVIGVSGIVAVQAMNKETEPNVIVPDDVGLSGFTGETRRVDGPVVAQEDFQSGLGKWRPMQWVNGKVQSVSPADQSRLFVEEVERDGRPNRVAVINGFGRQKGSPRIGIGFDLPREGDAYSMECDFFIDPETDLGGIFAGWTGRWFRMRKEFLYSEVAPGNIVVKLKTFFNGKLVSDTANPKSVMPERVYLIFDSEVARLMADNVLVRKMLPVACADVEEGSQSKN